MKMNLMIATAILAWCEAVDAAALPQIPGLVPLVLASGGLAVAKPLLPGLPDIPRIPIPDVSAPLAFPAPDLTLPPSAPIGIPPAPIAIPPVPIAIPNLSSPLPKLPVFTLPLPTVPKVPGPGDAPVIPGITLPVDADSVDSYTKVGKIVLSNILNLLWKGAEAAKLPGLDLPSISKSGVPSISKSGVLSISKPILPTISKPTLSATNASFPIIAGPALKKRQAAVSSSARPATATPAVGLPLLGGLGGLTSGLTGGSSPVAGVANTVSGVTSNLPLVGGLTGGLTGGSSPVAGVVNTVGGLTSNLPAVGSLTSGLTDGSSPVAGVANTVSGVTSNLPLVGGFTSGLTGGVIGTVANTAGSLPVVGGAVAPVVGAVGGLTSGTPVGAVGGAVSGPAGPVGQVASSVLPGPYSISQGIPGSDPVGGLSIAIIATLLSLLKKDPLSLFGGGLGGIGGLIKRDLPELADTFEIESRELSHAHQKRQLPSLSSGVQGVGIGGLPLSGVPGVSPDMAFLVGSIAKNIAVPGGRGLGSVTGNIINVLNGVVPNFLFKLPVVQDSVPTFGSLQLLASINPTKFGALSDLTNLATLSQAASTISPADIAFIKTLPSSADPSNLITTITTLTDNILSLPGNVSNLKASVSVLSLKNLGLAVQGL